MKIRIPVFQQNSLNERILRSGLVSQLRATPFTSGLISGTEMTVANGYAQNNYGYYEFEILGADLTKLLKLYVSADNVTFEQITTWGGTDGIRQKEYLVYTALLTQEGGTVDPTVTVLTNELGFTITWVRETTGAYSFSNGTFPVLKTFATIQQTSITTSDGVQVSIQIDNDTQVEIITADINSGLVDGALFRTSVEIRIYP